jgi:putative oxidoreductase
MTDDPLPLGAIMNTKRQLSRLWISPATSNAFLPSIVLLMFRLGFGWDLIVTARAHLGIVPKMIQNFTNWGVPFPKESLYVSAYTELICGALLMLGLATRFISIPLIFNFCVAYLTASRDEIVHIFTQNPSAIIEDSAFPFLLTALLTLVFGAGLISLDGWIAWLMGKRAG